MIAVSVIIPVYNAEKYLNECLNSIISQTLNNIEIICVDDGSVDNSYNILKEYEKKDSRFIVLHQDNQNAGVARNNGMQKAKGEYLSFLDADDFFERDMLKKMYSRAKQNNVDIVICNAFYYDTKNKRCFEKKGFLSTCIESLPDVFDYKLIPEKIFQLSSPVPWNKLFRKEFIEQKGLKFQNIKRSNDEYFVNLALIHANKMTVMDEKLVYYRTNYSESLQGMNIKEIISYDFFLALQAMKKELDTLNMYSCVSRSFVNKVITMSISALYKQQNIDNFIKIYNFIKKDLVEWLDFDIKEYQLFSNSKEIKLITEKTALDYIYLKFQNSINGNCKYNFHLLGNSRKIVVYGAGNVGREYVGELIQSSYYILVAWVDRNYLKKTSSYIPIISPLELTKISFDKIVIAIEDDLIREKVKNYLIDLKISRDKIIDQIHD